MPSDWIETFLDKTSQLTSPNQFRLWSAITCISGILERRVWTWGNSGPVYPNLFTILTGQPGSGKSIPIGRIRDIWSRLSSVGGEGTEGLHLSPNNVTKATLITELEKAKRIAYSRDNTTMMHYHALCIEAGEFGVFFVNHDTTFLSILNYIYDNPEFYREERIVAGSRKVEHPCIVILGGTQPDYLSSFMPEEAWGMGFASRLMLIFDEQDKTKEVDFFLVPNGHDWITELANRLRSPFNNLQGPFTWHPTAYKAFNSWINKDQEEPIPQHPRLKHYNSRRRVTASKLAMISSVSRNQDQMEITSYDLDRAFAWLFAAENRMPEIFQSMSQRSDSILLEELRTFLYLQWTSKKQKATENTISTWLSSRVAAERIPKLLELMMKIGALKLTAIPGEWEPTHPKS